MKLRQLRAALAVHDCGQIARAAQQLNLSQPAVSRALQGLEGELGVSLFQRGRAGSETTPAGRLFFPRIDRAMEQLQTAEQEVANKIPKRKLGVRQDYLSRHVPDHELRTVIKVGDIQSVSAAARALGISQPAANRSLRNMEKGLGLNLFQRTTQGMMPTREGGIIIRRAKLAFDEIRQALEEVENLKLGKHGQIRIGVLPLARALLVPLAVSRLLDRHELVDVSIVDGTYPSLLHELRHGEIDFIVGTIRQPAPTPDIASECLFEDDLVLVARTGHPIHRVKNLGLKEVVEEKWVLPSKGVPLRDNFELILQHMGCQIPRRVIETDSLAVVRSLLLEEDRLAVVSRYQIYHEEKFGLLKVIKLPLESSIRRVGITTREGYVPTPLARELMSQLRDVAKDISQRMAALKK